MNAKGYGTIPRELCYWITFLTKALPPRSIGTFIELLIGAMLTPTGFVTDAYLILDMRNHWNSYYKWLQKGKWSWLGLARQFLSLALMLVPNKEVFLLIDDSLTLRASKKAPGSQIHHQHGNKPNLADYVQGQCWVSLAMAVKRSDGQAIALPILSRLIPSVSNTGKLIAANTLVRAVYRLFKGFTVTVLVDSWYMRRRFIESALSRNFTVIGQARIDTRLYDEPPEKKPGQRGRPRKYGEKYTSARIENLHRVEATVNLYGKEQLIRYRSIVAKARFLKGLLVKAVWCELKGHNGQWKPARLFISTDTQLSAEEIIERYGLRWPIETMFHQLKQAWGLKEAWQQTRQTLHRWVHLTQVAYGLIQLLSVINPPTVMNLCCHSPWRKKTVQTAGHIRKGLAAILRHVNVREWWNPKCKKFHPPDDDENDRYEDYWKNAA